MKTKYVVFMIFVLSSSCFAEQVRTRTVAGRVIDYQARPVEGATVVCYEIHFEQGHRSFFLLGQPSQLSHKPLGRTSTNSGGRFSLLVEKDKSFYVVAGKQGLALAWKRLYRGSESTLRLGKPCLFKGTVVDEVGRPVPGAMIRICLKNKMMMADWAIVPLIPEGWFTTQTDERGRFLFDNVPAGATADFGVEAPGKALMWTICDFGLTEGEQYTAGRTDIRITLPDEARVKGQVVNKCTGQALAGARIMAKPIGHLRWKYHRDHVYSDPNGRFEFTGLTPDTYLLCATYPKEGAGNLTVTVASGEVVSDVRIPVMGIPLEVKVIDLQKGEPLENADVTVTQKATTSEYTVFDQTATTDPNGRVSLYVPPGECQVRAFKSDYGITFQSQRVQLNPGQKLRQELFLPRTACILSGEVVDEQGRLLSGASVIERYIGLYSSAFTDVNGRFKMSYHRGRPSSRAYILARHSPSGMAGTGVLQYSDESGRFDGRIVLKPAYTLMGRVIDPNGRSMPEANLKLLLAGGEGSNLQVVGSHSRLVTEATTDVNGVYRIRSVTPLGHNPKDDYVIVAYAEGFGMTMVSQIPFGDDIAKPVRLESIILQPADQSISGFVEDANEQPIASAVVKVYGPRLGSGYGQQLYGRMLTDAQGRFRFAGVCEEPLLIYAKSPWGLKHSGVTSAYGGNENIKVVLGQRLQFTPSLIGKTLPELKNLGINLSQADMNANMILVCFFDMNQRPSRNCLRQLSERAQELKAKNIIVVAVQSSRIDKNLLNKLIKDQNVSFPIGIVEGDEEEIRFAWGVKSLPWLILTDQEHVVRSEGFAVAELSQKVHFITTNKKEKKP